MRTIIEVPADQLEALEVICVRDKISRAEAIRRAVASFVSQSAGSNSRAFGLWRGRPGTGLDYQEQFRKEWGANAIFELVNGKLQLGSYYKLPAPQTAEENCVAHNGSLIPVPGRDIMVQAWYQGGVSVFDFTDAKKPFEIASHRRRV